MRGSLGCRSEATQANPVRAGKNTALTQTPLQAVGKRHLPLRSPCKGMVSTGHGEMVF